jgi:hypothetical protein
MLAEINFLRLEAIARASKEAAPAPPFRFVPLSTDALKMLRERYVRETDPSSMLLTYGPAVI